MNNCALNLSASVIATAQLFLRRNQYRIVSRPCNYYTLCLGRWVAATENRNTLPPLLLQLFMRNHLAAPRCDILLRVFPSSVPPTPALIPLHMSNMTGKTTSVHELKLENNDLRRDLVSYIKKKYTKH